MLTAMLAHDIKAAPGYSAKVIAPPGEMSDPLVMRVRGSHVWLNDDGKVLGDKGSRMLAVDKHGDVEVLVDADKMSPISAGFDIAPAGFRILSRPDIRFVATENRRPGRARKLPCATHRSRK